MADTHEEQLLSDLLRDVAREDARLEAAHLESSVMESAAKITRRPPARSRAWVLLPAAAAVLLTTAITVRLQPDNTEGTEVRLKGDATGRLKAATAEDPATEGTEIGLKADTTEGETVGLKPHTAEGTTEDAAVRLKADTAEDAMVRSAPDVTEDTASHIEFVPLLPMTEQELTGSFQIVRVQMPGASLGDLRSPLVQPTDMVEADVLLGEDGRARAIRVNTNGSIYPWRSR